MPLKFLIVLLFSLLLTLDTFGVSSPWGNLERQIQNGELSVSSVPGRKRTVKQLKLNPEKFAGRHLVCTAEIKAELSKPLKRWMGTAFEVSGRDAKGKYFFERGIAGGGHFNWKKVTLQFPVPADAVSLQLSFGTDSAEGKVSFRNLAITSDGFPLEMEKVNNMGFSDDVAGDGKGGWSDQGRSQDAAKFPLRQKNFGGVPFRIPDPARCGGKSMLVMASSRFPNGPKQAKVDFPLRKTAKYLYLLHCSAWESKSAKSIGSVTIEGEKRSVILPVGREDIVSSYKPSSRKNCWIGASWVSANGALGIGVARFDLPEDLGSIRSVTFNACPEQQGMWMIVSATLSDRKIEAPKMEPFVLQASKEWRPLPQDVIQNPKPGTALDLSPIFNQPPAGTMGHLIVNKDGHFAFEKEPDKPVRFMIAGIGYRPFQKQWGGIPGELTCKEQIDAYTASLKRGGYNAVRLWANPLRPQLKCKDLKAGEFDPEACDRVQYFIASLKKQGIYVFFTAVLPMIRFDYAKTFPGNDPIRWKVRWYDNPYDLAAWKNMMKKILTDINPYTKTRMADDPVFAMIDTCNEQEFHFMSQNGKGVRDLNCYLPLWKAFLKQRYVTDPAWKKAWGRDAEKFSSINDLDKFEPLDAVPAGQRWRDLADFMMEKEKGLMDAQRNYLRNELHYKGPVTGFLLGTAIRFSEVRRDNDFVACNGYVSHPFGPGGIIDGQSVEQAGSSEQTANHIRTFLARRQAGKPFLVSEHGHVYFNQYRFEQGFIIGGYAALNDWDALAAFEQPMPLHRNSRIFFFDNRFDTVIRASELLTALLFRRRDVSASPVRCAVVYDYPSARQNCKANNAINSEQLKLGLVCRVDPVSADRVKLLPKGTRIFPEAESSASLVRYADSSIAEAAKNTFDLKRAFRELGISRPELDPDRDRFISCTGELVLDGERKFLLVNTPRLQGICSRDRKGAELTDFAVRYSGTDSCIALASIDGMKSIREAKRMLLIISSNVLNSGTKWESRDMVRRLKGGTTPLLLHTGKYTIELKRKGKFICYALAADGTRVCEIPGISSSAGTVWKIDTSLPARSSGVYYEIVPGQ